MFELSWVWREIHIKRAYLLLSLVTNEVSMRTSRLFGLLIRPASIQPYRWYLNWVLYATTTYPAHNLVPLMIWNCVPAGSQLDFKAFFHLKCWFSQLWKWRFDLKCQMKAKNLQLISVSEEFVLGASFVTNSPPIPNWVFLIFTRRTTKLLIILSLVRNLLSQRGNYLFIWAG